MLLQSFYQTWLPFIYLYSIGGIIFFVGLYILIKSKALNLQKKQHRYWLKVLLVGFFFFLILHSFLIISALYF
jgi:hypothetical protein